MNTTIRPPAGADYWASVTDVPCPCGHGTLRHAEAGHVPGWRECDACGRQYQAAGDAASPTLEPRRGPTVRPSRRAKQAEGVARARAAQERDMRVWSLFYALEGALPAVEGGKTYHAGGVGGETAPSVTGDDLVVLDERARAVAEDIGGVFHPERIAAGIGELRRRLWPEAMAVYDEIRAALPREIKISVEVDTLRVHLVGVWSVGTYPAEAVRARLADLAARVPDILARPSAARAIVASILGV